MIVAALSRGIRARLENVTITCAHYQLLSVDTHFDTASLARPRRIAGIVTETVLPAQFFRHRAKSVIKVLLLGVVKSSTAHAREVVKISIGELVFALTGSRTAARPVTAA